MDQVATARGVVLVAALIALAAVVAVALIPSATEVIVGFAFLAALAYVLFAPHTVSVKVRRRPSKRGARPSSSDTEDFAPVAHH